MKRFQQLFFALLVAFAFVACNSGSEENKTATNDTTKMTTPTTAPTTAAVPDAVTAAPNLYKSLKDSMGINIIEVNYQPGDSSVMHSHKDYALYVLQGGNATFYGKDGSKTDVTMPTGMATIKAAEVHSVKNTGKTPIKVILFEVNRGNNPMTWDSKLDATKVAPTHYKLLKDTMGIRLIEVSFKPGESAAMHSHPDQALYVIEGSTAEFTGKDGKKTTAEMKPGMAAVMPGETHMSKNAGKTTMKAVLVEVSRQ